AQRALLRLGVGAFGGFRYVRRDTQEDIAAASMVGFPQGLPIHGEVPGDLRDIEATQADEDGIAHLSYLGEGLLGCRRDTDGWMRLLIGFGQHAQVVAGVVFPLIRETLFRPGFEDDLEMLVKALTAFRIRDSV